MIEEMNNFSSKGEMANDENSDCNLRKYFSIKQDKSAVSFQEPYNGSKKQSHPSTFKSKCKRSASLEDLSPHKERTLAQRRRIEMRETGKSIQEKMGEAKGVEYLMMKGYSGFLKNSWRKSRNEGAKEKTESSVLKEKVASMSMQISTLKYIVANDEQLVASWAKEIQKLKLQLTRSIEDVSTLRQEKVLLERRLEEMDEENETLKTEAMNERNNCLLARSEASALETQLTKEREKISKLKKEIKSLTSQLTIINTECMEKDKKVSGVAYSVEKLEEKIYAQEVLLKLADDKIIKDSRALQGSTEAIENFRNDLTKQCELNLKLSTQIKNLERNFTEQEKSYTSLENCCQKQMLNLVELQVKNYYITNEDWLSCTLNKISSFAAIPLAIVDAIAFPEGPLLKSDQY